MSEEQKTSSSYMQELDKWTEANVIDTLVRAFERPAKWEEAIAQVKKAIREKVLQSYKNGRMTRLGGAPANLPTPRRYPVPMRKR